MGLYCPYSLFGILGHCLGHFEGPSLWYIHFEQVLILGWSISHDGILYDLDGMEWSVFTDKYAMVRRSVYESWVQFIVPHVREDEQFQGMQPFDLERVRGVLTEKDQYNTVLANYTCGAIVSSQAKQHFLSNADANCSLCGKDGSATHMLYFCSGTKDLAPACVELLRELPNAVKVSGLFPVPPNLREFRVTLSQLPSEEVYFFDDEVYLFTDGSAFAAEFPCLTLASWAIALAERDSFETTLVASAPLPGCVQSINRAELWAIVQATRTARGGHVFTDSQYAYDGMRKLQTHRWIEQQWTHAHHYDLWMQLWLWQSIRLNPSAWTIHKIKSHSDIKAADSVFERWCIHHNSFVDAEAKKANCARPSAFLELHEKMKHQYREQAVLRSKLSQLQSVVSVAFRSHTTATVTRILASVDHWQLHREHLGMMAADRRYAVPHADRHLDTDAFLMHAPFVNVFWRWMISQQWVPDEAGISVAELYISFAIDRVVDPCQYFSHPRARETYAAAYRGPVPCLGPRDLVVPSSAHAASAHTAGLPLSQNPGLATTRDTLGSLPTHIC